MRQRLIGWALLGVAGLIAAQAVRDAWQDTGRAFPGFGVMENLLVGVGGLERGGLQPFDLVRAMDGRIVGSAREIQAAVRAHPAGTSFHYILNRGSRLVEADVPSVARTRADFHRYLLAGFLTGVLFLALGAAVLWLRPGVADTHVFLGFCLVWFCIPALYRDAHATYRFSALFLAAVAACPAVSIHLALTFPQRRSITRRQPRVVWLPYLLSAGLAVPLIGWVPPPSPDSLLLVPALTTAYWCAALILVVLSLARTSQVGATPLMRQRARVLMLGFAAGQLVPVLGTAAEAIFRIPVPQLQLLWRLNILFPLAVAYAMVRYNLFELRAVIRTGAIYGAVTAFVALAYAAVITALDLASGVLGVHAWPIAAPIVLSLTVVLLLNPVYVRIQRLVDRMFFRQRLDIERSIERLSDSMTTLHDLDRIAALVNATVEEFFHPARRALFLRDAARGAYRAIGPDGRLPAMSSGSALASCLALIRSPLTRERLDEDPGLRLFRAPALEEMTALGVTLVVPIVFRARVTGFVALGDKRSGAAYSTFDLRVLRFVANQSAVALEHAQAYTALQSANTELRIALRRVEILESIRASLAKFVPATVQRLIEAAPDSPELDKREVDVSVLFVDIAGYTRWSEQLDPGRANELVERYFGAFLDEILRHGGDVNETAGDGLMVIFRDGDPRHHARAAVLTAIRILDRAARINRHADGAIGPVALHVAVNSGVASVGATKIEGTAGTRWTYTASGSVTNIAARLAALSESDGVLIGPETRTRIDDEFPVKELGDYQLRNVEEPVRVFRIALADAAPLCVGSSE